MTYDYRAASRPVTMTEKGSVVTFSIGAARVHTKIVGQNFQVIDADSPVEMRGQGIGKDLYRALFQEAARQGKGVVSDFTVEDPAAHVWEAMKREGFPVHKHPKAERIDGGEGIEGWFVPGLNKPVFWVK